MTLVESTKEQMNLFKQSISIDRQVFFFGISWTSKKDYNYYVGTVAGYKSGKLFFFENFYGFTPEASMSTDILNYLPLVCKFFQKRFNILDPSSPPIIYLPSKKIVRIAKTLKYVRVLRFDKEFKDEYISWVTAIKPEFRAYRNGDFPYSEFSNYSMERKTLLEAQIVNGAKVDHLFV